MSNPKRVNYTTWYLSTQQQLTSKHDKIIRSENKSHDVLRKSIIPCDTIRHPKRIDFRLAESHRCTRLILNLQLICTLTTSRFYPRQKWPISEMMHLALVTHTALLQAYLSPLVYAWACCHAESIYRRLRCVMDSETSMTCRIHVFLPPSPCSAH